MKLSGFKILIMLVILFSSLTLDFNESKAQTPFTNTGKAKYIKTTVDTFSVPGMTSAYKQGFITNQSSTLSLNVMFSKRDGSKDTSSRVVIPAGKTLHFNFVGTKIFRYAVTGTDSVYSQVIIGDVQLNFNEKEFNENFALANQTDNVMSYFLKDTGYWDKWTYSSNKGYRREKIYATPAVIADRKKVFGRSDYFWGS
jgi:hypothetical protein